MNPKLADLITRIQSKEFFRRAKRAAADFRSVG